MAASKMDQNGVEWMKTRVIARKKNQNLENELDQTDHFRSKESQWSNDHRVKCLRVTQRCGIQMAVRQLFLLPNHLRSQQHCLRFCQVMSLSRLQFVSDRVKSSDSVSASQQRMGDKAPRVNRWRLQIHLSHLLHFLRHSRNLWKNAGSWLISREGMTWNNQQCTSQVSNWPAKAVPLLFHSIVNCWASFDSLSNYVLNWIVPLQKSFQEVLKQREGCPLVDWNVSSASIWSNLIQLLQSTPVCSILIHFDPVSFIGIHCRPALLSYSLCSLKQESLCQGSSEKKGRIFEG